MLYREASSSSSLPRPEQLSFSSFLLFPSIRTEILKNTKSGILSEKLRDYVYS